MSGTFIQIPPTSAEVAPFDPTATKPIPLFDEFISRRDGLLLGDLGWAINATGSGGAQLTPSSGATNRPGKARLTLSATTSSITELDLSSNTMLLGDMSVTVAGSLSLQAPADATNNYRLAFGLTDNTNPISVSNGVYFEIRRTTNATNWSAVTKSGSTETATDTGIPFTTPFINLRAEISKDASSVGFYIDGNLVATNTTNIPTVTPIGPYIGFINDGMAVTRYVDIEWFYMEYTLGSTRGTY